MIIRGKTENRIRRYGNLACRQAGAGYLLAFVFVAIPMVFAICEYVLKPLWHLIQVR